MNYYYIFDENYYHIRSERGINAHAVCVLCMSTTTTDDVFQLMDAD